LEKKRKVERKKRKKKVSVLYGQTVVGFGKYNTYHVFVRPGLKRKQTKVGVFWKHPAAIGGEAQHVLVPVPGRFFRRTHTLHADELDVLVLHGSCDGCAFFVSRAICVKIPRVGTTRVRNNGVPRHVHVKQHACFYPGVHYGAPFASCVRIELFASLNLLTKHAHGEGKQKVRADAQSGVSPEPVQH